MFEFSCSLKKVFQNDEKKDLLQDEIIAIAIIIKY